jgi:hypothetical protein
MQGRENIVSKIVVMVLFAVVWSGELFAASIPPVGYVDKLDRDQVVGWAKDPDNLNVPVSVHVYCYPRGRSRAIWGISVKADKYRSDVGAHGFRLDARRYRDLPDGEYEIVAYAIGKDKSGANDGQNVALKLSLVGREVSPTRQVIRKDTFAHGKYQVFSQYLGILWDEPDNYDMYHSAVRLGNAGTVYNYYTRQNKGGVGETVFLRSSPNGITKWSDFTRVLELGRLDDLDSGLIADGNVVAVAEGSHFRLWLHYTGTPGGHPNYVFQATTTSKTPKHFIKRTEVGNTLTAVPLFAPSYNNRSDTYGAGQPSLFKGGDGLWHMYFTDTTVLSPVKSYVVHKSAPTIPYLWRENTPASYATDVLTGAVRTLNSAEFTYYPRLKTYAAVRVSRRGLPEDKGLKEPRVYVGQSPTVFDSDPGYLVHDYQNPERDYITEGGLLRNLKGQITTTDNSTIAYYGIGKYSTVWKNRYWSTATGATRFYLYKL